jgi:hypothetical protein
MTRTDILVIEGTAREVAKGLHTGRSTSMMISAVEVAELCRLALEHPTVRMQAMPPLDAEMARDLERKLHAALAREQALRTALAFYTRNGPIGKDAWQEGFDSYGHCWNFDWPGDKADNPWEIAESALSTTPTA